METLFILLVAKIEGREMPPDPVVSQTFPVAPVEETTTLSVPVEEVKPKPKRKYTRKPKK